MNHPEKQVQQNRSLHHAAKHMHARMQKDECITVCMASVKSHFRRIVRANYIRGQLYVATELCHVAELW